MVTHPVFLLLTMFSLLWPVYLAILIQFSKKQVEAVRPPSTPNDCQDGQLKMIDFSFRNSFNEIKLTIIWKSHNFNSTCTPLVHILVRSLYQTSDTPHIRREIDSQYTISNLRSCTLYNVTASETHSSTITKLIFTLPTKVNNLDVHPKLLTENYARLTWQLPVTSECVTSYRISGIPGNATTNELFYNIPSDYSCKIISVTPMYRHGYGAISTIQNPGPLQEMSISINKTNIKLKWRPPIVDYCVTHYEITLFKRSMLLLADSTNDTFYEFANLEYCAIYDIRVRAFNKLFKGDPYQTRKPIGNPNNVGTVQNFSMEIRDNELFFSWSPAKLTRFCSVRYKIWMTHLNLSGFQKETKSTQMYISEMLIPACTNKTLFIRQYVDDIEDELFTYDVYYEIVPNSPQLKEATEGVSSVTMHWLLDSHSHCEILELVATCITDTFPVEQKTTTIVGKDINSKSVEVTVTGLLKSGLYACYCYVRTSMGTSPNSAVYTAHIKDRVKHQNVTMVLKGNTAHLRWSPQPEIAKYLTHYDLKVQHYPCGQDVPDFCQRESTTHYSLPLPTTTNQYSFDLVPGRNYTICLQMHLQQSDDRIVDPAYFHAFVPAQRKAPMPPKNLGRSLLVSDNQTVYNVTVQLTWNFPCEINGPYRAFRLFVYCKLRTPQQSTRTLHNVYQSVIRRSYMYEMNDLPPYSDCHVNISTVTEGFRSEDVTAYFLTPEYFPGKSMVSIVPSERGALITWKTPLEPNGIILAYHIFIRSKFPFFPNDGWDVDCELPTSYRKQIIQSSHHLKSLKIDDLRPWSMYIVAVAARTAIGYGPTNQKHFQTLQAEPEPLRNIDMIFHLDEELPKILMNFSMPCQINGRFVNVTIGMNGRRNGYPDDDRYNCLTTFQPYTLTYRVKPAYNYVFKLILYTEYYSTKVIRTYEAPAAAPKLQSRDNIEVEVNVDTAELLLKRNLFSNQNGDILYYAIIVGENGWQEGEMIGTWNFSQPRTWPTINTNQQRERRSAETGQETNKPHIEPYQATPSFWNPFQNTTLKEFEFLLGDGTCSNGYCNAPIEQGIEYSLKIRAFTKYWYKDTPPIIFKLQEPYEINCGLIIAFVFGVIPTIITITVILVITKGRREPTVTIKENKENIKDTPLVPIVGEIADFPSYYQVLIDNPDLINDEFTLLGSRSSENSLAISVALLAPNKNKNRYSNILPYDDTRVKLTDTTENNADYINASHIKGFSNCQDYIATQGPLKHTCTDFWQMVLQEQVSVIVMLTQIIEQKTEKCYKYFPTNENETMEINEEMSIHCKEQSIAANYCVRSLIVKNGEGEETIPHLHFTKWPDFGCPGDVNCTLDFIQVIREYAKQRDGKILIHCSAGVGRTGTLIALDILLEQIERKKPINVFETVLYLRMQRKNMVQTEKQYLYIHSCINAAIKQKQEWSNGII